MAAAVTITPNDGKVGDPLVIAGTGFLVNAPLTVTVEGPETDLTFEVLSDDVGDFSSTDAADHAVAVLTSDGVNVTADDTVTIGAVTYTFKASPTTTANEVKVGADAATSLANLKKAINLTGVAGTDYGSATVIHPTVSATTLTATTLRLVAKTAGTGGNSLASTEASTHLSFGGTTFSGGAAASGVDPLKFVPSRDGEFTVTATDGSSTASATTQVFVGG